MKYFRLFTILTLLGLAAIAALPPQAAQAAPFDPRIVKVTVDNALWSNYHLDSTLKISGDSVKAYKINKVDVIVLVGNNEFLSHSFTPKDHSNHKFTIPHGLTNVKIRLIAHTAEDGLSWSADFDYKGNDTLEIKSQPSFLTLHTPGI